MVFRSKSVRSRLLAKLPMKVFHQMQNDRDAEKFRRSLPGPDWDHFRYAKLRIKSSKRRALRFRAYGV
jgi:hypothetical protein